MSLPAELPRRIICAAVRYDNGVILCGARHFDTVMHTQAALMPPGTKSNPVQGFIDQLGDFYTREEALKLATQNGQVVNRVGGDETRLYSENLY